MTTDSAFERIEFAPIMTLQTIEIPDTINQLHYAKGAEHLIDTANDAIEAFMLADQAVIENFVTCDFHLLDQAITWIEQNHLLAGNRFCEFGAGFGVGAAGEWRSPSLRRAS